MPESAARMVWPQRVGRLTWRVVGKDAASEELALGRAYQALVFD